VGGELADVVGASGRGLGQSRDACDSVRVVPALPRNDESVWLCGAFETLLQGVGTPGLELQDSLNDG
jgi:hypothetical protein